MGRSLSARQAQSQDDVPPEFAAASALALGSPRGEPDGLPVGLRSPTAAGDPAERAAAVNAVAGQPRTAGEQLDRTSARRLGRTRPAVSAGRSRLRPDSVGALVHAAIAVALAHDPAASAADAGAAVQELVARDLAQVYRTSLLHRGTTATAVYLRELSRDVTEWSFMASEVRAGDVHLDLLFAHRDTGQIQSDEVATGLLGPPAGLPWVMQRIEAQLQLGRATFGDRFKGVRLVDLPRRRATLVDRVDV